MNDDAAILFDGKIYHLVARVVSERPTTLTRIAREQANRAARAEYATRARELQNELDALQARVESETTRLLTSTIPTWVSNYRGPVVRINQGQWEYVLGLSVAVRSVIWRSFSWPVRWNPRVTVCVAPCENGQFAHLANTHALGWLDQLPHMSVSSICIQSGSREPMPMTNTADVAEFGRRLSEAFANVNMASPLVALREFPGLIAALPVPLRAWARKGNHDTTPPPEALALATAAPQIFVPHEEEEEEEEEEEGEEND